MLILVVICCAVQGAFHAWAWKLRDYVVLREADTDGPSQLSGLHNREGQSRYPCESCHACDCGHVVDPPAPVTKAAEAARLVLESVSISLRKLTAPDGYSSKKPCPSLPPICRTTSSCRVDTSRSSCCAIRLLWGPTTCNPPLASRPAAETSRLVPEAFPLLLYDYRFPSFDMGMLTSSHVVPYKKIPYCFALRYILFTLRTLAAAIVLFWSLQDDTFQVQ